MSLLSSVDDTTGTELSKDPTEFLIPILKLVILIPDQAVGGNRRAYLTVL
jgi:hypothetical protein